MRREVYHSAPLQVMHETLDSIWMLASHMESIPLSVDGAILSSDLDMGSLTTTGLDVNSA